MIAQLDLFGSGAGRVGQPPSPTCVAPSTPVPGSGQPPKPVAPAFAPATIRGDRVAAWDAMLRAAQPLPPVRIIVARDWTGVVLEDLSHPTLGRKMLHYDGRIVDYPDTDKLRFLTTYMKADQARTLHIAVPLIPQGSPGTACTIFRLAGADEEAPLTLKMPEGL